ncbi:nuclear transport factor 2 NTF2 domain containing protein [Nitzschia inconspicua]|uniref:Nuclear transport factor 2 NTF2 domain containing protein n=1 Tax=Nitzschia inconspicua TaxID=303405 RepID=A0A9K3LUF8_9STRA|nr:nuclear transport factor 2 NTF2 domain containing protein [Nitzschia inconspicua]
MSDSTGPSPPPPDGGAPVPANPPHFKVGLGFVKAYYKTLTEQPELLVNFYKAGTSYLGHGEGSAAADPKPLEEYDLSIKERWGCSENEKMRFDFEYGAIDTQPVIGGVLLVVTAQVFFESPKNGDGAKSAAKSKSFVQTFFLVREGRNFACYNDVLRFVEFNVKGSKEMASTPTTATATASTNTTSTTTADVGVATDEAQVEDVATSTSNGEVETTTTKDAPAVADEEAPGGGVEETKEEAPDSEEEVQGKPEEKPAEKPVKDGKGKKNKGGSKGQQQQQQSANKPAPGSWASLVATGGSAPNTPSRKPAKTEPEKAVTEVPAAVPEAKIEAKDTSKEATSTASTTAPEDPPTTNDAANNNKPPKGQTFQQRNKRDPDNTLVIKNLSDNIKEQDIINMFKPFAVQTNSKILGTNLNHNRGLAFVDYDQVAPVLAALAKHQETPFQWNGKVLEVDQKTQEVRARRQKGGGYNRSGSPGNGFRNGGGSSGRGGDARRGDRGGGRRSGRGGRGGR